MSTSKVIIHTLLDRWMRQWALGLPDANAPLAEYKCDIALEEPLYNEGTMRGYIEHTGRQRFEVIVGVGECKRAPRYFPKRRIAKKYMRKQLARTKTTVFKGCYPTSVLTASDGTLMGAHGLNFAFTESIVHA